MIGAIAQLSTRDKCRHFAHEKTPAANFHCSTALFDYRSPTRSPVGGLSAARATHITRLRLAKSTNSRKLATCSLMISRAL